MDRETEKLKASTGEMQKRRTTMEDGRRYLIYYTFGQDASGEAAGEENGPARENRTSEGNENV